MKKLNKKGFTMVELVIVIAVIAILAGVLIPTFSNVIEKAKESKVLQEAKNAQTDALVLFYADGVLGADEEYTVGDYTFKVVSGKITLVDNADDGYTVALDGNGTITVTKENN